ncbi:MAG: hypothetical protein V1799_05205 [bacterium]
MKTIHSPRAFSLPLVHITVWSYQEFEIRNVEFGIPPLAPTCLDVLYRDVFYRGD